MSTKVKLSRNALTRRHNAGESWEQIAKSLGIAPSSISRFLKSNEKSRVIVPRARKRRAKSSPKGKATERKPLDHTTFARKLARDMKALGLTHVSASVEDGKTHISTRRVEERVEEIG